MRLIQIAGQLVPVRYAGLSFGLPAVRLLKTRPVHATILIEFS